MKKNRRFLGWGAYAFGIFCAVACTQKQPFETVQLGEPVVKIGAFSDSTYFSQVSYLVRDGDDLYASDSKRGQVFRLDARDLALKQTIGKRGQGPQDIMWCKNFGISRDTLAVFDFVGDRVQMYDKNTGDYLASVTWLKKNFGISSGGRTPFETGRTVLCLLRSGAAMLAIDLNDTTRHKAFGEKYESADGSYSKRLYYRYVLQNDKYILTSSDLVPVVEKYTKDGELVEKYDLSQVGIVKKVVDRNAAKPVQQGVFYPFVQDAYLHGDRLYIMVSCWEGEGKDINPAFQIVELDVASGIQPVKAYRLPYENAYSALAVDDDYFYLSHNRECEILKFKK